ncbi:MAG TPA: hypothetical protein PKC43_13845 [Phycisphaerales bacterium]|nr:hypothetical protein [Phycisphaerales bacterium]HMP38516.1 hypothetical protein [Phycisphaerales bacterium]
MIDRSPLTEANVPAAVELLRGTEPHTWSEATRVMMLRALFEHSGPSRVAVADAIFGAGAIRPKHQRERARPGTDWVVDLDVDLPRFQLSLSDQSLYLLNSASDVYSTYSRNIGAVQRISLDGVVLWSVDDPEIADAPARVGVGRDGDVGRFLPTVRPVMPDHRFASTDVITLLGVEPGEHTLDVAVLTVVGDRTTGEALDAAGWSGRASSVIEQMAPHEIVLRTRFTAVSSTAARTDGTLRFHRGYDITVSIVPIGDRRYIAISADIRSEPELKEGRRWRLRQDDLEIVLDRGQRHTSGRASRARPSALVDTSFDLTRPIELSFDRDPDDVTPIADVDSRWCPPAWRAPFSVVLPPDGDTRLERFGGGVDWTVKEDAPVAANAAVPTVPRTQSRP